MSCPPAKLAFGALGILILLLLIGNSATRPNSHHSSAVDAGSEPTSQAQVVTALANQPLTSPTPRTPRTEIQGQDRYNNTARFRSYERYQHLTRPAYQHLPYRTSQVRITIINVTSDGRVVLSVTPLSANVNPQAAYRAFLARYHDPGSAYVPLYARYGQ
jgi:hypothetical protein